MDILFRLFLFLSHVGVCLAGKYSVINLRYRYCSNGCCGSYHNQYCCSLSSWKIGLFVLAGVAVIAAIAISLLCWRKKKRARMAAIGPQQQNITTVTYVNQAPPSMYHGQPGPRGMLPPPPPLQGFYPPGPAFQQPHYTGMGTSMAYNTEFPPPGHTKY